MKTATIRELKHETTRVLGWAEAGEVVEVRRRGKLAVVINAPPRGRKQAKPDFAARLKAIYGDAQSQTTATELISEARGKR